MSEQKNEAKVSGSVCPYCLTTCTTLDALKAHITEQHVRELVTEGWGMESYPHPKGVARIECDEMKCVGCGICQMACSMYHFGVINKNLARIEVRHYLLPLPKAVQVTCQQCQEQERECEKACPVTPKVIYFDKTLLHIVIDEERCLGESCLMCRDACSAKAIKSYPAVSEKPFVCDLCEKDGNRKPQCIEVCPYNALYFKDFNEKDMMRKHADEKADLIARRLYPLPKKHMAYPGW